MRINYNDSIIVNGHMPGKPTNKKSSEKPKK